MRRLTSSRSLALMASLSWATRSGFSGSSRGFFGVDGHDNLLSGGFVNCGQASLLRRDAAIRVHYKYSEQRRKQQQTGRKAECGAGKLHRTVFPPR